jgi:hypothetical protein
LSSSLRISLAELPKAIIDAGGAPTTYFRAYHACVAELIPAKRSPTGRWSVAKSDIPDIAIIAITLLSQDNYERISGDKLRDLGVVAA